MNLTENLEAITKFLFIEEDIDTLKKSDLLIILCNNNLKGITNKFEELYKNGKIDDNTKVIVSGNRGPLDDFEGKECDVIYNILVNERGYNPKMFILEGNATNIRENLLFSKDMAGDLNKYNNILVQGASFALRRIKMCSSKLDYPLNKVQFVGMGDFEERGCEKDKWWINDEARIRVFQEIERIGKYLVKGDLDIK